MSKLNYIGISAIFRAFLAWLVKDKFTRNLFLCRQEKSKASDWNGGWMNGWAGIDHL